MPPVQCPSCGRFLKSSLVASLVDSPAPCPGCGDELRPDSFDGGEPVAASSAVASAAVSPTQRAEDELHGGGRAGGTRSGASSPSVRPPDLPPDEVRGDDALRGWDVGAGPQLDAWRVDRPPFPTDTVVVAGAGLAGAVLGAALGRERRAATAAGGALVGVVAAAVARRLWQLES